MFDRASLQSRLTVQIVELIRRSGLVAGDRLPPVAQLAKHFSVANPTVREALSRLEAIGVIEVRHGSGTFIAPDYDRLIIGSPHAGEISAATKLELVQARALIEPHIASLVASAASDEHIQSLNDVCQQAVAMSAEDQDAALRHATHVEFHRQLARSAGNRVLAWTLGAILDVYAPTQAEIFAEMDPDADAAAHMEIARLISARDASGAEHAMTEHLSTIEATLRSVIAREHKRRRHRRSA